jgi:hypothetical protein
MVRIFAIVTSITLTTTTTALTHMLGRYFGNMTDWHRGILMNRKLKINKIRECQDETTRKYGEKRLNNLDSRFSDSSRSDPGRKEPWGRFYFLQNTPDDVIMSLQKCTKLRSVADMDI